MRSRVSITIDKDILKKLDSSIDGIRVRSRSGAIELILKEKFPEKSVAVILAGGDSEKLRLGNTYRPLVNIGGKTLIEDIIEKVKKIDFSSILIIGRPMILSEIFKKIGDGKNLGVDIKYIEEEKTLGSAKTLELAKEFVNSTFLFLPCDHYFDFNLEKMLRFHKTQNDVATLAIYSRTDFEWNTSIVQVDGHKIVDYEEYPKKIKSHLRGMMVCFAEPNIFNYIPPGNIFCSLQEDVFQSLVRGRKMTAFMVSGDWVNVHTEKDVSIIRRLMKQ